MGRIISYVCDRCGLPEEHAEGQHLIPVHVTIEPHEKHRVLVEATLCDSCWTLWWEAQPGWFKNECRRQDRAYELTRNLNESDM